MTTLPRTGVFLVRAWSEEGRFRARITSCLDINSDIEPQVILVTADPEEVQRRLGIWLGDFGHLAE
jgi:hypothetical protein